MIAGTGLGEIVQKETEIARSILSHDDRETAINSNNHNKKISSKFEIIKSQNFELKSNESSGSSQYICR